MSPDWSARRRAASPQPILATITNGGWGKADVCLVEWEGGRAVLKDFGRRRWPVRLAGRLQVRRELRAYRRLESVAGIPRILARVSPWAFVMEEITGKVLARYRLRALDERRGLYAQLGAILERVHAAGVIHNDIRGHDNAVVSEDGRVFLLDFAGAICLRPGGLAHRLLFRRLARVDEGALLKWKRILLPEDLTAEEIDRLHRYELVRRFWIFNPKGRGRKDPLAAGPEAGPEPGRGR